jgi:hypothetical protein
MIFTQGEAAARGAVVPQDVGIIVEHAGRADVVPQHVARRGNRTPGRQMIHQRARELRPRRPRLLVLGEGGIHRLSRGESGEHEGGCDAESKEGAHGAFLSLAATLGNRQTPPGFAPVTN